MNYNLLTKKYLYYYHWAKSMAIAERDIEVGRWVISNIILYSQIIKEYERATGRYTRPTGNYP